MLPNAAIEVECTVLYAFKTQNMQKKNNALFISHTYTATAKIMLQM